MKDIVPPPPAIVRNDYASIRELFAKNVVPSYGRFELVLSHGHGSYVFDVAGKRYLDLGSGIAVCCLGHAHPAITEALVEQSKKLIHVSNLYFTEPQGRLAAEIVKRIGAGKVFFSNSGAEANEGLYKLARKFGHAEGRFEILTATNSFHGRTLAGIAATGQEKVKIGFEPAVPGFRHIPFNNLEAARNAISPATAAILIEGVQGEGGVTPATPEYLLGLRSWTACSAAIIGRDVFKVFKGFSKAKIRNPQSAIRNPIFCRTDFQWQSRSAADFPSARFGCANRFRICSDPARTPRRSAARRSRAP